MVQVQAGVGIELAAGHRGLVDEGAGLEDDDRTARPGELGGHDPTAGTGTDDDDVRSKLDRAVSAVRAPVEVERPDGAELVGRRGMVRLVADRGRKRVRRARRAGVRICQERDESPERGERGPLLRNG
jgi:hypothetical protein